MAMKPLGSGELRRKLDTWHGHIRFEDGQPGVAQLRKTSLSVFNFPLLLWFPLLSVDCPQSTWKVHLRM